jgi:MFS transporter, DHA2 family, multidrug resistance protein
LPALLSPAHDAFVHGMHVASGISAVIALLGVFVVLKWMPGRPKAKTAEGSTSGERETAGV